MFSLFGINKIVCWGRFWGPSVIYLKGLPWVSGGGGNNSSNEVLVSQRPHMRRGLWCRSVAGWAPEVTIPLMKCLVFHMQNKFFYRCGFKRWPLVLCMSTCRSYQYWLELLKKYVIMNHVCQTSPISHLALPSSGTVAIQQFVIETTR